MDGDTSPDTTTTAQGARRDAIAARILREGRMGVEALAAAFAVSAETVRRDLTALAEAGRCRKVHGGAVAPPLGAEGSFAQRMAEALEEKRAIARRLAALVEPGDTLMIDTGSTTLIAAEALGGLCGLTVITNAPAIARLLARAPGATVFLLGGTFRAEGGETLGPLVIEQVARFQADRVILTAAAVDARGGAMDADLDEAQLARAMVRQGGQVVVLADHTKFDRRASFPVCGWDEVDLLVADRAPEGPLAAALERAAVGLA